MTEIKRYSKSIRRARAAIRSLHTDCELCDRGNQVKWKCNTCEELLCDQCKVIHLRSRISNKHEVSLLTRESRKERQNNDPSRCILHPNEKIHMYCTDCQSLVCPDCIIKQHLKHPLQKLAKTGNQKRCELESCLSTSKQKLDTYMSLLSMVQKNQMEYEKSVEEMTERLHKHADELKQEIDKRTLDLIVELENIKMNDILKMKTTESQLKHQIRILKEWLLKAEENILIVRLSSEIQHNLDQVKSCPVSDPIDPPVITYGETDLGNLIGQLSHDLDINSASDYEEICPDIHLRVLSTFIPRSPASHVCVANGNAWFRYYSKGDLHLVSFNGKVMKTVNSDNRIHDLAINRSGELLLTVLGAQEILKMTNDGQFVKEYNVAPYSTLGLCTTNTDDLFVCAAGHNDETAVLRLSTDSRITQIISTYPDGKTPLFDTPMFVTQSKNGNICVSNYNDNECFSVLILDQNGQHKNTYTGQTGEQLDHGFTAWYLQTDYYNNILVSDTGNSCIHVLNKFGNFVQFLFTSQDKLGSPGGMSIDSMGKLWVCTDNQSHQDDSSKVHIIQYLVYQSTNL